MSRDRAAVASLLVSLALLAACGGASAHRATTTLPMPHETTERHDAMDAFGRRLHAALSLGRPTEVLLGDDELRALLDPGSATRVAARRAGLGVRLNQTGELATALAHTEYLGVCLQDARDEDDTGVVGLRGPGWIFGRVLVAAQQPGGRRVGLWVDGLFVFTNIGIGALDLERVEVPRWEHSDLELAPCDMATALR